MPVTKLIVDEERCKGCELCLSFCPRGLLRLANRLNSQGFKPVELSGQDQCTSCALCARMCPETAIEVYREPKGGS